MEAPSRSWSCGNGKQKESRKRENRECMPEVYKMVQRGCREHKMRENPNPWSSRSGVNCKRSRVLSREGKECDPVSKGLNAGRTKESQREKHTNTYAMQQRRVDEEQTGLYLAQPHSHPHPLAISDEAGVAGAYQRRDVHFHAQTGGHCWSCPWVGSGSAQETQCYAKGQSPHTG